MKTLLSIFTIVLLGLFVFATPISVVYGIHDWSANDIEFKVALWSGVKLWATLLVVGALGFVSYYVSLFCKD